MYSKNSLQRRTVSRLREDKKNFEKKYESAKKHFPFLDLALKRTRQKETRNLFLSGPSKNQSKFLI